MRFMIATDCEGAACVVGRPGQGLSHPSDYQFACDQITREADAAARALLDSGADEVIVWDNHGWMQNIHYEKLDKRCKIMLGCVDEHRWTGMDKSFAGVLMVGYHSMSGTVGGVLSHSYSSDQYQYIKVNGVEVGEIEIDAAMAGEMGVPLLFVASDQAGVDEAKRFMPHVRTVATKKGFGWHLAVSKHPLQVVDEIYDTVRQAFDGRAKAKPFRFRRPVVIERRYTKIHYADLAMFEKVGWQRVDAYTVRRKVSKISDCY
ncbi:MAG: M55 family metallopeptidase [Planctomycetes bacterium]|nr:M55 family metallopeptidase [Planctomycetota bacterium]